MKAFNNAFALIVACDELLVLLLDHDHVVIDDEADHEVIRKLLVPLLTHFRVKQSLQVGLDVCGLISETHAQKNAWPFTLNAVRGVVLGMDTHARHRLFLRGLNTGKCFHLVVEKACQI